MFSPYLGTVSPAAPRAAVLVDLENLLHPARTLPGDHVRRHLEAALAQVRRHVRPVWLTGCCDWWLAKRLLGTCAEHGLRVHPGPIGPDRADGELCRRAFEVPLSVDTAVIISGDSDLLTAVTALQQTGRRVLVAAQPERRSRDLAAAADGLIELRLPLLPHRQAA